MLPENKWSQYGRPNAEIKGIVIHNTNVVMSADQLFKQLETGKGSAGCHYIVDDKKVRKVMPETWSCFSTGRGNDFGNTHCIAIEICSNPNTTLYYKGQGRAIELIREVMKRHSLTKKDIYFHRDFQPNINCPAQILKIYGSKSRFLGLI